MSCTAKKIHTRHSAIQLLEAITLRYADAINARDFNPSSSAWANVDEDFRAEAEFPNNPRKLTLVELFSNLRQMAENFPDHYLHIRGMDTTINEKTGHAELFMHVEVSGAPEGVTRQGVGILIFKLVEDQWRLVGHRTAAGMDMTGHQ